MKLHILYGSFLPVTVGKEWDAKFVQFQGKSLPFTFFLFERPLLQNCIMHSSICTNGYFLSCYVDIHARNAAGETRLSQSDTTYWGRPHSQPVCCDQCTFHTSDPKLRFNYCWMDKITSKSTLYFSSFINNYKKSSNPGLSPNVWGDKG